MPDLKKWVKRALACDNKVDRETAAVTHTDTREAKSLVESRFPNRGRSRLLDRLPE